MKRNPFSRLTHNLSYKIISLLIAIVIWYAVVYVSDPKGTESYTVRVQVVNDSYIANGKQVYSIDDVYKQVTVYVKGNRSKLSKLSSDSISVTADLTQIVDLERDPVSVPLSVTCKGFDKNDLTLSRNTIPIVIEDIASKEFPISVTTGDSVPGKNYEVGSMTVKPESVMIKGPESIINSIESVQAKIDVTNMTFDRTRHADLTLIDHNQNPISEQVVGDDLSFDGGVPDINVDVHLWKKAAGIKFRFHTSGQPMSGYVVGAITSVPEEITVAGTAEALAALEEAGNIIDVPADRIVIDGQDSDTTFQVDIADLLPEGMKVSSSAKSVINVNVAIMPFGTKTYSLDMDKIEVMGLAQNRTVSYDQASVELRVQGAMEVLRETSDTIKRAYIDVTGLSIGDHILPVKVELVDGCSLVSPVEISVHIKEKAIR